MTTNLSGLIEQLRAAERPTMLQRAWWRVFGEPAYVQLMHEAQQYGVPVQDAKFWPASGAFGMDCRKTVGGARMWTVNGYICPEIYKAKVGDVVPAYCDDVHRYLYTLAGYGWFGGDDHIVSPKHFHIIYAGRELLALQSEVSNV